MNRTFALAAPLSLALGLGGCAGEAPEAPAPRAEVAPVATFSVPQRLGYVWWTFAGEAPIRTLELRFTIPEDYPRDGLRVTLAEVRVVAPGGASPAELCLGFASRSRARPRAAQFSRSGSATAADARPAAGGWSLPPDPAGASLGVANAFAWAAGTYLARLEWRRGDAQGVWYGFTLAHEASGDVFDAGELRFPPGATLQPAVGSWIELTGGPNVAAQVPPWELVLEPPRADGAPPLAASTAYGALENVDVSVDRERGSARLRFGGATPRRHAAGSFSLSGVR
ncbi:MAG: hypothetical protein KDD82_09620 [Planctomycetes bacterium]|nr:hypothetical protein [Planctomycetota bacterium]